MKDYPPREKNHVNFSDGVDGSPIGGFGGYGMLGQGILYFIHFPFLLYHQMFCKYNKWCELKSEEIYKKYTLSPDWYSKYLTSCEETRLKSEQKVKTEIVAKVLR